MRKIKYIYLLLISSIILAACSKDDIPGSIDLAKDEIAIRYGQKSYVSVGTRNINASIDDEEQIDNIYILMAKSDLNDNWIDIKRYYTGSPDGDATFSKGQWSSSEEKVIIKLTQSQAGERDVYVIANISTAMKTALDGVNSLTDLQGILESKSQPWSGTDDTNNLKHPILMSGMKSHDFSVETGNRVLGDNATTNLPVQLVRAFAKVELNVKLPSKHQSTNPADYKYNFVDFDKNTYVLENTTKAIDAASTGNYTVTPVVWVNFSVDGSDQVSSYVKNSSGKITELKIVTYINETTDANSYIELQLPYNDDGLLPPPEFGPETFILPRQGEIKRNHWYKFDIEL